MLHYSPSLVGVTLLVSGAPLLLQACPTVKHHHRPTCKQSQHHPAAAAHQPSPEVAAQRQVLRVGLMCSFATAILCNVSHIETDTACITLTAIAPCSEHRQLLLHLVCRGITRVYVWCAHVDKSLSMQMYTCASATADLS